jgi:hypothetical protein
VAEGTDCDDGNDFTYPDTCSRTGECIGANPCDNLGPCQRAGIGFGACIVENRPAGSPCGDSSDPCRGACDGAGSCVEESIQAAGTACHSSCGKGTCDATGACTNVVEQCQVGHCGEGYCDPVLGCVAEFADPDCHLPGAFCYDFTDWCIGGYCGDGWCGENDTFEETVQNCEDCLDRWDIELE